MTSAAALPGAGAALRVLRGAAGRRLVQVLLLVGGVFVLGMLGGERANAAEQVRAVGVEAGSFDGAGAPTHGPDVGETAGAPPRTAAPETAPRTSPVDPVTALSATATDVTVTVGDAVPPVGEHIVEPVTRHVVRPVTEHVVRPVAQDVVQPVTDQVLRPVTDDVLPPVADDVLKPVGDLVEAVTGGLGDGASHFPPSPQMPSWPGGPGLPGLPGLPELPEMPALPGETLPVDVTPREPGGVRPEGATEGVNGGREHAAGPASVVHGPYAGDGDVPAVAAPHRDAGTGDARAGRVPGPQGPDGLPTGALGGHSAVDNGGPRHAEPHAVTSSHRAPLSLVPGATAADAADGTRDRHRDIPEFPG